MPRGGKRNATPGKGYSNRTDLAQSIRPAAPGGINPAAAGGLIAPGGGGPAAPGPQAPPQGRPQPALRTPDDTPMLSDPTNRPGEPLTAGLDSGPGPGSDVLGLPNTAQQISGDMQILKQHLPLLRDATKFTNAPQSFKRLVNFLEQT